MKIFKLFNRKKYPQNRFVLCLDGGGMRGIIPIRILMELSSCFAQLNKTNRISTYFDLIAGTSTGGLIALALSCTDQNLENMYDTYKTIGNTIFPSETVPVGSIFRTLTSEKYSIKGLEKTLFSWFGETKLSCANTNTLIMSYDVLNGKETEFCSWKNHNIRVFDAARATSAAPTYFAPFAFEDKLLVDGGIIANNPSLFALTHSKELWPDCTDLTILSIGTAANIHTMESKSASGIINWMGNIAPMFMNAQKRTVDILLNNTAGVTYTRIEAPLNEEIRLDDFSPHAINLMINHAENLANEKRETLKTIAEKIIESRNKR